MQKAEQINSKDALLSKYLPAKKSCGKKKNFKGETERIAKQEKEVGQMDRLRLLLNILKFILGGNSMLSNIVKNKNNSLWMVRSL